jgi:hypothetical protein
MGRSRGVIYQCDGCEKISAPRAAHELPPGFHGSQVQVVADGWGGMLPEWWACSDECLRTIVDAWIKGEMNE